MIVLITELKVFVKRSLTLIFFTICTAALTFHDISAAGQNSINMVVDEVFARNLLGALPSISQKSKMTVNLSVLTAREIGTLAAQKDVGLSVFDVIIVDKSQMPTIIPSSFSSQELPGMRDRIGFCSNNLQKYNTKGLTNTLTEEGLQLIMRTNIITMGDVRISSWGVKTFRFLKSRSLFDKDFFSYVRNVDAAIMMATKQRKFSALLPKSVCMAIENRSTQYSYYDILLGGVDVTLIASVGYKQGTEDFIDVLVNIIN